MRVTRFILLLSLLAFGFASLPTATVYSGEDKFCPVHHVQLSKEEQEITYGLVVEACDTLDRAKSSEKYFPYANSVIYGGCLISIDSPKFQEVLYCPKCREVERTWPCVETGATPIITTLPPSRASQLSR